MNSYCAFSGGKDSTALALLCPNSIPIFTDTGWEPEEIYRHIDKFERVTGRKVLRLKSDKFENMPDAISRMKYLPGFKSRYCTRIFKIEPMNKFLETKLPAELLIGLRADEDEDLRVGNLTEIKGLEIKYPMREQNICLEDVERICRESDLLPEYPIYMRRGGCIGCYFKSKREIMAMDNLRPDILNDLENLEESIQDSRERFAIMFPNIKMSIKNFRKNVDLFKNEEEKGYDENRIKQTWCGVFCHR